MRDWGFTMAAVLNLGGWEERVAGGDSSSLMAAWRVGQGGAWQEGGGMGSWRVMVICCM